MNRPRQLPLTLTRILVRSQPARDENPAGWSAAVRYLGIGDAVLDRLADTVEVRS